MGLPELNRLGTIRYVPSREDCLERTLELPMTVTLSGQGGDGGNGGATWMAPLVFHLPPQLYVHVSDGSVGQMLPSAGLLSM